ncbi:hypothetical protein X943_004093 [Babesia divergens]|uniref:non-specific serine/threonine protein kinase n=1 Tax=Babesia divergens TaxID=32595 RepID=A0AAD9G848_BABDI|nr:hypothetical protein X943_004093 [Babesia divergens]
MESTGRNTIIAQGAEAQVTHICYLGQDAVLKTRMQKKYRHPDLDEALTSKRIIAECRAVAKLRKSGIYVPLIYLADIKNRHIVYEFIKGETVHSTLAHSKGANNASVLMKVGTIVAKMHDVNIVHGDLTTHNMLRTDGGDICLIDFGLSFVSTLAEVCSYIYRHMRTQDKAVDLYVLERCCTTSEFDAVTAAYKAQSKNAAATLAKLAEVRMRGRKRDLAG